jgi:hypothetical protein
VIRCPIPMHASVQRLALDRTAMAEERARGLDEHRGMFRPLQDAIAVGAIVQCQTADFRRTTHRRVPSNIAD